MGALLAFEMARLATTRQIAPASLFVVGARPPHLHSLSKRTFDLPEPEFLHEVRNFNGTPQEVLDNEELLAFMMPILRSDFEAVETYVPVKAEPLCCPIVAFGGIRDPTVSEEDLRGWRQYTTAEFSYFLLPGDHFFINAAPLQLATKLAGLLRAINR
jgi:medium-chain acyl-[acyl-carrier-protein] hydrolase